MAQPVSKPRTGRPLAVTTEGASQTRRKSVGDRNKTGARLLRSTAEKFYDAEVDIDWDAPIEDGKLWMSEHRVSLYGTKLWDELTPEQRAELGKHEMVSILSFGIYAEAGLSTILYQTVLKSRTLVDDHVRYALAEIGEETRHSIMFSRLINKTGLKPYLLPKIARRLSAVITLLPTGPSAYGGTLLIEEILDRGQREVMNDPDVQPHARQLMKIHVLEEARHITYAREQLVRGMAKAGPVSKAFHRIVLATIANGVFPVLVNPRVYRSVGIHPLRGFLTAFTSDQYLRNTKFMAEPMARFFYDAGMAEGRVTRLLWRLTRGVPDDILAEWKGERPDSREK